MRIWQFSVPVRTIVLVAMVALLPLGSLSNGPGASARTQSDSSRLLWQFTAQDKILAAAAIADGVVYVRSDDGVLYALDATTGHEIWHVLTSDRIEVPVVANDLVYVTSDDGVQIVLSALDAATGTQRWVQVIDGKDYLSDPQVSDNRVFISSDTGHMYAFDGATGALLWQFATGSMSNSSLAVAGDSVFIASEKTLYALDVTTGTERWRNAAGDKLSRLIIEDTILLVRTKFIGSIAAIDSVTGAALWTAGPSCICNLGAGEGGVYWGGDDEHLYAYNVADGSDRWTLTLGLYEDGAHMTSPPAVANGVVYVGDAAGVFYAVDAASGIERWRFITNDQITSKAVIVGNVVYVGSNDGNLYALMADQ